MILLSVDTSGLEGSLALARLENGQILNLHEAQWLKKAMHSEVATVKLQELLTASQTTLKDLTHLTVNVGPGSFTGLRVGLSLVKTLAYTLGVPVFALNSLQSLAFVHAAEGETLLLASKAVQNFFYVAGFCKTSQSLITLLEPQSVEGPELESLSAAYTKVLIEGRSEGFLPQTRASGGVRFVSSYGDGCHFSDWKSVEPLYIRASEAEEKMKKGLLKPL